MHRRVGLQWTYVRQYTCSALWRPCSAVWLHSCTSCSPSQPVLQHTPVEWPSPAESHCSTCLSAHTHKLESLSIHLEWGSTREEVRRCDYLTGIQTAVCLVVVVQDLLPVTQQYVYLHTQRVRVQSVALNCKQQIKTLNFEFDWSTLSGKKKKKKKKKK